MHDRKENQVNFCQKERKGEKQLPDMHTFILMYALYMRMFLCVCASDDNGLPAVMLARLREGDNEGAQCPLVRFDYCIKSPGEWK